MHCSVSNCCTNPSKQACHFEVPLFMSLCINFDSSMSLPGFRRCMEKPQRAVVTRLQVKQESKQVQNTIQPFRTHLASPEAIKPQRRQKRCSIELSKWPSSAASPLVSLKATKSLQKRNQCRNMQGVPWVLLLGGWKKKKERKGKECWTPLVSAVSNPAG